jgi:hypothetical protein
MQRAAIVLWLIAVVWMHLMPAENMGKGRLSNAP